MVCHCLYTLPKDIAKKYMYYPCRNTHIYSIYTHIFTISMPINIYVILTILILIQHQRFILVFSLSLFVNSFLASKFYTSIYVFVQTQNTSNFRIVNTQSYEKQIYQLEYSICMQLFCISVKILFLELTLFHTIQ